MIGVMKMVKKKSLSTSTQTKTVKPIEVVAEALKPTTISKKELKQIVDGMSEAMMCPTQRWYGEKFYPEYMKNLALLKQLAE